MVCGPKLPVCHSQRLEDAETPRRHSQGHIRRENTHLEVQRIYRGTVVCIKFGSMCLVSKVISIKKRNIFILKKSKNTCMRLVKQNFGTYEKTVCMGFF